jgi:tryptophanyl-tRNA synthetase
MSAVTDSGSEVKYDWGNKPGISNLLEILSQFSDVSILELEKKFLVQNYGQFKTAVADEVEKFLIDFQKKYTEISGSGKLDNILNEGAQKAYQLSHPKLLEVYKKVGFLGQ